MPSLLRLTQPIRRAAAQPGLRGGAAALLVKIAGSGLAYGTLVFLARRLGDAEFGHFAIWFNAASFLAVAALCGQETLITRAWNEHVAKREHGLALGALVGGVQVVAAGAVAGVLLLTGTAWLLIPDWSVTFLAAVSAFLIAQALVHYAAHAARVVVGFAVADVNNEITWRGLALAVLAVLAAAGAELGAASYFCIASVALGAVGLVQLRAVRRALPPAVRAAEPVRAWPAWRPRALRFWGGAMLASASQYLDVVLIGLLLDPVAAGLYFACARTSNIFGMISSGMSIYSSPRIARLHFENKPAELQRMCRSVALLLAVITAASIIAVLAAGRSVLGLFGSGYEAGAPVIYVLTFGMALMTLAGPAPHLLLLTGHEAVYLRIAVQGLVVRSTALLLLAPTFGALGAAAAWTVAAVATAAALVLAARRRLGIDPSILALFGRRVGPEDGRSLADLDSPSPEFGRL